MNKLQADILVGNNIDRIKELADNSVQCVVTSPPYWGLRDYGTATWIDGDENCSHRRESKKSDKTITGHKNFDDMLGVGDAIYKQKCPRCGATREDLQVGLEESPSEFVENLCKVFDEIWRVLKDDGTLWVNLGDSYSQSGQGGGGSFAKERPGWATKARKAPTGLKAKELVGIPWRFAFAMQDRGWYLRQDIIWHKPNPMPESVTDRCTKSHEYIFLLTKKPKYYFDNQAIKEPVSEVSLKRAEYGWDSDRPSTKNASMGGSGIHVEKMGTRFVNPDGRNKRSVWTVTTKPYKEAHFATYPPDLIEPCILAGSKEGDIILDPFSGSGTTGEVALRHNRHYIGLELNPEYAEISRKRISEAIGMFADVQVQ